MTLYNDFKLSFLNFKITFQLAIVMGVDSIDENFLTPHQQSNLTHLDLIGFRMK